ncbi:radical SAM protein [Streptomyces halstedii]|uniref:radical SAM protein n=1 Tax=Streptomyces halstedii TaxID=1944 RepID=UPI0033B9E345
MAELTGIDTYIIKTVEWCNLDCTYCYFYHGQDTSFEKRPRHMSRAIIEAFIPKMIEHSQAHGIDFVHLTFHGGEPLLQAKEDFIWMMEQFDRIDAAGIRTARKLTTNGVTLNDEWAELMARYDMHLAISLDGSREIHDAARVDLAGRGSYDRVVRGLRNALKWEGKGLNVGTITVLNPTENGAHLYRHLRSLGVKSINLILPEANYVTPIPVVNPDRSYAQLLKEIFDAWVEEDDDSVDIGFFGDVVRAVAGAPASSDQFGFAPVRVAVLETDGSVQPTDNFRSCADGMVELGISIFRNSLDDLYYHDFFQLCINQRAFVPEECGECKFVNVCGGGRISTRYSREEGFKRKSVHCEALYGILDHAAKVLQKNALV